MTPLDITQIPFNRDNGMVVSDRPDSIFMFPADERYLNHLGTVHAAVLFTLAEASSGEFLQRNFANGEQTVVGVVRRTETKYRRPARGAVHARASANEQVLAAAAAQLRSRGRTTVAVQVDLYDGEENHVMHAKFEWFANLPT